MATNLLQILLCLLYLISLVLMLSWSCLLPSCIYTTEKKYILYLVMIVFISVGIFLLLSFRYMYFLFLLSFRQSYSLVNKVNIDAKTYVINKVSRNNNSDVVHRMFDILVSNVHLKK